VPRWEKSVWINGQAQAVVAGPHPVRPGDSLVVVDRVGDTFSETFTATLSESWDAAALALVSSQAGAGSVAAADGSLTWNLRDVPPNTTYVLTKTFQVQSGTWTASSLLESLAVEGAAAQLPDIAVALSHVQTPLTLAKSGPPAGAAGDRITLTLTVGSDGTVRDRAVLTDTLPAGMTFAGNLAASYGTAWQQANAVYWESAPALAAGRSAALPADLLPALPAQVTVTFDVFLDGSLGQVIRNTAELDWGLGHATASHDVRVGGAHAVYLPVIFRGY
jgi:uncharacterized repeat protein (TIGR01451 family)